MYEFGTVELYVFVFYRNDTNMIDKARTVHPLVLLQ